MENKKNFIATVVIALSIIITACILGNAYKNRYEHTKNISVTGKGTRDFASDLIVWNCSYYHAATDLKQAYQLLNNDREIVKKYFGEKGVKEKEIIFSSVNISRDIEEVYDNNGRLVKSNFRGYILSQDVTIESNEVDKIENISREITELINQGVEISSQAPHFYYTKLAELKIEMIAEATKDATTRAQKIAENANGGLGSLKKALMGVFQITGQNTDESYSWGGVFNTTSKRKTASITISCEFDIR